MNSTDYLVNNNNNNKYDENMLNITPAVTIYDHDNHNDYDGDYCYYNQIIFNHNNNNNEALNHIQTQYSINNNNNITKSSLSSSYVVDHDYEYNDPLREDVPENERTNYPQTLMNLLNGIIGSGVLSMPLAFKNGGWLLALIITPVIGIMSAYCIHLLLAVNVKLMQLTNRSSPFEYHEVS